MANSLFEEKLNSNEFLVTTEVGPPKGADISEMIHHIDLLKDRVDALNVTDHQSSVMRFPLARGLSHSQGTRWRAHSSDDLP